MPLTNPSKSGAAWIHLPRPNPGELGRAPPYYNPVLRPQTDEPVRDVTRHVGARRCRGVLWERELLINK